MTRLKDADSDAERATLTSWLEEEGLEPLSVEPLTGDVSLRRYFRVLLASGGTAVLAWYPEDLRPVCHRFVATSAILTGAGVPVPRILATRCSQGMTLLEDAGERTVHELAHLGWPFLAPIYRRAAEYIPRFQTLSAEVVGDLCPPLNASLLRWELEKTWELFLQPRGLAGSPASAGMLWQALETLCELLGSGPAVPCHRDFMVRNLMLPEGAGGELLVLDHQDLRLGPPAYDLASLLNDSLFPPQELEDELVAALLPGASDHVAYRRTVVQRTLKAIGNYCDFARRGLSRHLPLVRPTLARAWAHLPHLPETREIASSLRPAWLAYLEDPGEGTPIC